VSQLYVIATPIGNLGDVSVRSREALGEATAIVAEDTRRARQLLSHLGITQKALSRLDAHAGEHDVERVLERLARGETVALLTDAGTPSVSDPGARVVRACHERGIRVVPVPGPSAVTSAIAASGLVEGPFLFVGFLPRTGGKRRAWLDRIGATEEPVVLFEAANRLRTTLKELAIGAPDRLACVARELTKKFESIRVLALSDWTLDGQEFRGEVTVVLGPGAPSKAADSADLDLVVRSDLARGKSPREIADAHHALLGVSRRTVYQRALELKSDADSA
jgi:16S rRNA (cytidine1402-2'-O)-methyltransferase